VAGRVDHKGDETVLLADSVWAWEEALAGGEEAFAQAVAAGDRGRRSGRGFTERGGGSGADGAGGPGGLGGPGGPPSGRPANGGPAGRGSAGRGNPTIRRTIPRVSPLRGGEPLGTLEVDVAAPDAAGVARFRPSEPVAASLGPPSMEPLEDLATSTEEPPLPDEAARTAASVAAAPTRALEAPPGAVLHVGFGSLSGDRLTRAFETIRAVVAERPGSTPVVLHVPLGDGRTQSMELRPRVAYDAELMAAVERRVPGGEVRLDLR